jgi:hypothetical protein
MKTKSQKQIILEELEKGYALSKMITHKVTDKTFAVYYLAKFENKLWPNKRLQA